PEGPRRIQGHAALPSHGREHHRDLGDVRPGHGGQVRRRGPEGAGSGRLRPDARRDAPLRDGEDRGGRPGSRDGPVRADLREPRGRPEQAGHAGAGEVGRGKNGSSWIPAKAVRIEGWTASPFDRPRSHVLVRPRVTRGPGPSWGLATRRRGCVFTDLSAGHSIELVLDPVDLTWVPPS